MVAENEVKAKVNEVVEKLRGNLNDKELAILDQRLLNDEPLTLQTIADQFQVSRERVRQIEANLLTKMRTFFEQEVPDIHNFIDEILTNWRRAK